MEKERFLLLVNLLKIIIIIELINLNKIIISGEKMDKIVVLIHCYNKSDRLSSTYFTENKRPFHNFGNSLVRFSINHLFKTQNNDIMTGYRAMSYHFVKTFPVISKGFEIETEMSIHAAQKNLLVRNHVIEYKDRPEGSESKLNTFQDGFKVIGTIIRLFRTYKPMQFFSWVSLILCVIGFGFLIPVISTYVKTGLVFRFPTFIACCFVILTAIISFFSGLVLETINWKNRQDFEMNLINVDITRKLLEKDNK